ncbi:MAG: hypothetical protein U5K54_26360 [Cytophagales bacterium]|nr:hypothetical protein [Cytophagales bacterium]
MGKLHTMWYSYPEIIHSLGARGTNMFGLSRVISALLNLKEMQTLYMDETSRVVEWSGALEANLIPYPFLGKDVEPLYKATTVFYSGVPSKDWIPANFNYANLAIEKLLVVNNNIPPLEFATTFNSADINRFRKQLYDLVRHKKNVDELNDAVNLFNSMVKQHDAKKNREWDISGFVLEAVETATGLSLMSWTIERIHMLMRQFGVNNQSLSTFLDSIETETLPSAVLVSRMRDQLANTWKNERYS